MNAKTSKNLKLSIEARTRIKTVKAEKDALARFAQMDGDRHAAIGSLNARRPMARLRATGYEGDGALMLEASSNLQREGEEDAAWSKYLLEVEKARVALMRVLLKGEAILANQYGAEALDLDDDGDDEEYD